MNGGRDWLPFAFGTFVHMTDPKEWTRPASWHIQGADLPGYVWDIVQGCYLPALRTVRDATGLQLVPSRPSGAAGGSCYRPASYEKIRGRSGSSLHCFPGGSLGACDLVRAGQLPLTLDDVNRIRALVPFARLCWYPNNGFVHVDYFGPGVTRTGRGFFTASGPAAPWRYVGALAP